MEFITALWAPILVSAVAVFVISSLVHMLFGYHGGDYGELASEETALKGLRDAGVSPGDYMFPYVSCAKDMNTDEAKAKMEQGPVGFMTVLPNGPWQIGKQLTRWFIYTIVVGVFVAYMTSLVTFGPDADFGQVMRIASTAAFLAYAGAEPSASIWKARSWAVTAKFVFDGLLYALATGAVFGWLWPS